MIKFMALAALISSTPVAARLPGWFQGITGGAMHYNQMYPNALSNVVHGYAELDKKTNEAMYDAHHSRTTKKEIVSEADHGGVALNLDQIYLDALRDVVHGYPELDKETDEAIFGVHHAMRTTKKGKHHKGGTLHLHLSPDALSNVVHGYAEVDEQTNEAIHDTHHAKRTAKKEPQSGEDYDEDPFFHLHLHNDDDARHFRKGASEVVCDKRVEKDTREQLSHRLQHMLEAVDLMD
jgi:hypothetical protein